MNFKINTLFFLFTCSLLLAQSKTNLEMINGLVDSSVIHVVNNCSNSNSVFSLSIKSPKEYSELNQRVMASLVKHGIKLNTDSTVSDKINYSISQTTVQYSDLFRDGLFGDYLLERSFVLSGDYLIQNSSTISKADVFNFTVKDTIPYSNYAFIENYSIPFTKNNVPEAPFIPSLLEPIVAITAVALTVVLFFSVRSK